MDLEAWSFIGDIPIVQISVQFGSGSDYSDVDYDVIFDFIDGGPLSAVHYSNLILYDALLNGRYEGSDIEQAGTSQNSGSGDIPIPSTTSEQTASSSVGSIIQFGSYEQDNDFDNGAEPINWLVIDEDSETGKVLLLSTRGLDCQKYHNERVSVSWSNSDIRFWLNSTFLNEAFSDAEQARIAETLTASDGSCYDRVFFLDEDEIYEYQDILEDCGYAEIIPTAYAKTQGAYCQDNRWCWWWVRSQVADKAACRTHRSDVIGGDVTLDFVSIRPAVWITL